MNKDYNCSNEGYLKASHRASFEGMTCHSETPKAGSESYDIGIHKMLNKFFRIFQHDKLSAFTLAEVLITLGIIGVVAALTIPNLMQKTNDKELVSQYLKVHNMLSNALKETEAIEQMKFYKMNYDDFIAEFEDHLKVIGKEGNTVTLADGSQYTYGEYDETCATDNICMRINVDTNGSKKKPNKAGKDWFTLLLTKNGIKALGESETCSEGWDCGAYVLANHKLWNGEVSSSENGEGGETPAEETPAEPVIAKNWENVCGGENLTNSQCYYDHVSDNTTNPIRYNNMGISYSKAEITANSGDYRFASRYARENNGSNYFGCNSMYGDSCAFYPNSQEVPKMENTSDLDTAIAWFERFETSNDKKSAAMRVAEQQYYWHNNDSSYYNAIVSKYNEMYPDAEQLALK